MQKSISPINLFFFVLGRELVENIEFENRTRKLANDEVEWTSTPQDTLDTIERIDEIVSNIRKKQQQIEGMWSKLERSLNDTKDLSQLEGGVVRVINWILGPAENLLNSKQKVGYDVLSAEELRREHEDIELECLETYGSYAELIHKINNFSHQEYLTFQHKDLIYQKDFMDFVCKSFAMRMERRRNILITSLRFFRLVSEYFDKTGEVFDQLIMKGNISDFGSAAHKLKALRENQAYLGKLIILPCLLKNIFGTMFHIINSKNVINKLLNTKNCKNTLWSFTSWRIKWCVTL